MGKKIIISAYNIHTGGGKVLLDKLLEVNSFELTVLKDRRFDSSNYPNHQFIPIQPTLLGRLNAEFFLYTNQKNYDYLLCLGNLPPLFSVNIPTSIFLQNAYLVITNVFNFVNFKSMIRLIFEKNWLKLRLSANYKIFVQSFYMKRNLEKYNLKNKIISFPFYENISTKELISPNTERKLLAVTSGDSHKNVNNLLMALRSLHKQKRPFSFDLVLSRPHSNRLLEKIRKCISDGVRINLIQKIERENLLSLYRNSDALVFPSLFESFALPLIEARSANLPIIASERDFVREACTPIQTFDPNSSTSIANAIDRFLGVKSSENRIHDAESFLNEVVSD